VVQSHRRQGRLRRHARMTGDWPERYCSFRFRTSSAREMLRAAALNEQKAMLEAFHIAGELLMPDVDLLDKML
jgi:hypothetical protein